MTSNPKVDRDRARCLVYQEPNQDVKLRHIIAADIETDGLGGDFIMGATLTETQEYATWSSAAGMVRYFVRDHFRNWEMVFHNADYDVRYLLPIFQQMVPEGYEFAITLDGTGRIIFVTISRYDGKQKWYIRDSYALMPMALAKLAPLAGMEKLDIGLAHGTTFDPDNPIHLDYLRRDVSMLLAAFQGYTDQVRHTFGVRPAITAGSTAMRAFRTCMEPGRFHYRQRKEVDELSRAAYYGGLTFCRTIRQQTACSKLDVNAMYAAAMLRGVPTNAGAYTTREVEDWPGIYRCYVEAPADIPFTFVPQRVAGVTRWPRGRFNTVLCSNTIELARQLGYRVETFGGFFFDDIEPVFTEFVERCERLELEYKARGLSNVVIKILRNSLYGKFGQRPTAKEYYLRTDEEADEDMTPAIDSEGNIIDYLYWREVDVQRAYMLPHWAAWITAEARNMLARAVYAIGPDACYYGDTDSIVADTGAIREAVEAGTLSVGNRYGQWKVEGNYREFRVLAPKVYTGVTEAGQEETKHKGIPVSATSFDEVDSVQPGAGLNVQFSQLRKAIKSMGGDMSVRASRELNVMIDTDRWRLDRETGRVEPPMINEAPMEIAK